MVSNYILTLIQRTLIHYHPSQSLLPSPKGAGIVGTLAMPFIRPIQRRFFQDVATSMRTIVRTNQSE